jgi:hypothetical protein
MLDEGVAGRWRQFDGTLLAVAARMASFNPILTAEIGLLAAAAAGVGYLAYQWIATETAIRNAVGEMTIAGTVGANAAQQIAAGIVRSKAVWDASASGARGLEEQLAKLSGPAAQFTSQIRDTVNATAQLTGQDVGKIAEKYVQMFSTSAGALRFAESIHLLTTEQLAHDKALESAGQASQVYSDIMAGLNARFVQQTATLVDLRKQETALQEEIGLSGTGIADPALLKQLDEVQQKIQEISKPTGATLSSQTNEDAASVGKLNTVLQRRQTLTIELAAAERSFQEAQASGDPTAQEAAINAVNTAEKELASLHTATEEEKYQTTLSSLQQQLEATKGNASQIGAIYQQIATLQAQYYGQYSSQARAAQNQVVNAAREAANQQMSLKLSELNGEEEAARDSVGKQIAIERQKLAILTAAGPTYVLQAQEAQNRIMSLTREAGDREIREALDTLRAKQELAGQDYTTKEQIETQILAMLASKYGQQSTEYQQEKVREAQILQEAENQKVEITSRSIEEQTKVDSRRLQQLKANLDQEVVQHKITKQQELQDLESFEAAATASDLKILDNLIATLKSGTIAWQQAKDQRDTLEQTLATDTARYNEEIVAANQKASEQSTKLFEQGFDAVDKAFTGLVDNLITQQEPWINAERKAFREVVSSAVSIFEEILSRWIVTQLAMTADNATQNAVRHAQDTTQGSGFIQLLEFWLSKYLGIQFGMTAANEAGNAVRTAEDTTALSAGEVAQIAAAKTAVATDAGEAFAGAYASAAQIPVVGWSIAPGIASAAEATVLAAGSFAVGSYSVPSDMLAQVHQGEMIIPETFAASLRGALGGGSQGSREGRIGNTINLHSSPNITGTNTAGLGSLLASHTRDMQRMIVNTARNGQLSPPSSSRLRR